MSDVDVVVVGAGVVGLACAARLARTHDVLVVERHTRPGTETSSRNSGVVHAGLYYPPGSWKARTCVEGRRRLFAYASERGIPHERTGKLVLAVDAHDEPALLALEARARDNGVESLTFVGPSELRAREPNLRARLALEVGDSGIVDAHALVATLKAEARDHGVRFAFGRELVGIDRDATGYTIRCRAQGELETIRARLVLNAAGLDADRVATNVGLDVDALGWRVHPWKGDYFVLGSGAPRTHAPLVYPLPTPGGLGVHLTRDLAGRVLAGPDANASSRDASLDVSASKADAFARAVARYLPDLRVEHLTPGYAGQRPKLRADGSFADFVIEERPTGVLHLVGIESPGLTAALAIAAEVERRWCER